MSDLSRLTEALETYGNFTPARRAEKDQFRLIVAAARLVVDGQDVWWCGEHDAGSEDGTHECPAKRAWDYTSPCRMVSARLTFPKQGEET